MASPRKYTGNASLEGKLSTGADVTRSEFLTYLRLRQQDFASANVSDAIKPMADWWNEFSSDFLLPP